MADPGVKGGPKKFRAKVPPEFSMRNAYRGQTRGMTQGRNTYCEVLLAVMTPFPQYPLPLPTIPGSTNSLLSFHNLKFVS